MAKRVLLCLSHSIEEYDQLKLLHSLGYEVASIGGYIDPARPHDQKRPALPEVPRVAAVKDAVDALETDDNLGAAQSRIPEPVLEWLGRDGVLIFHHYLERLFGQWEHLREWRLAGGRVIWRTVGQSVEANERRAAEFRAEGLEVVRYSPREANIPGYCGSDALIRFYKDFDEWTGWTGEPTEDPYGEPFVANVTQNLLDRHPFTNAEYYLQATENLNAQPAGPGSERLPGGLGELPLDGMQRYLRDARCYLYTGTQPASYTLGLLEALATGVPVVSITRDWMRCFPYGPDLFEGDALTGVYCSTSRDAAANLRVLLQDSDLAARVSQHQRWRARQLFGREVVGRAWREYLGT